MFTEKPSMMPYDVWLKENDEWVEVQLKEKDNT
jgi:hypothetical protein